MPVLAYIWRYNLETKTNAKRAPPILNGFEAARRIRNNLPHVSVIIVSSHSDPAYVEEAFRSGAEGYVFKGSAAFQLVEAIQHVSNGRTFHPT
jgi:DNA-binding NarL/FixJ family response regulator